LTGEGTITLTVKHKGQHRQLAITISSTERKLLTFVLETCCVGKITSKRTYQDHHLPSYTYAVYNRQALSLLEQIVTYLQTYKLERAKLVLSTYLKVTPRNGKYSEKLTKEKKNFEKLFFEITARNQEADSSKQ